MAPRSRTAEFLQCAYCSAMFLKNFAAQHQLVCGNMQQGKAVQNVESSQQSVIGDLSSNQVETDTVFHPCIKDNVLYANVMDTVIDSELNFNKDTIVMIHPDMMKMCSIQENDYVVLWSSRRQTLHFAFSSKAVKRTSIAFCSLRALGMHQPNSIIKVLPYFRTVQSADELTIATTHNEYWAEDSFKQFVSRLFWDSYVTDGESYSATYKNILCDFSVLHVSCTMGQFDISASSPNQISMNSETASYSIDMFQHSLNSQSSFKQDEISASILNCNSLDQLKAADKSFVFSTPKSSSGVKQEQTSELSSSTMQYHPFVSSSDACDLKHFFHVSMSTFIKVQPGLNVTITKNSVTPFEEILCCHHQMTKIQKYFDIFLNSGGNFPHGILMYGPSGIGKSHMASYVSSVKGVHFIKVLASELFYRNHIEGKSILKSVFREACDKAPSVIFLDDIDLLCTCSQALNACYVENLVDLLWEVTGKQILVLCTASDINSVDQRLRHPGLLDIDVEFTIPGILERNKVLSYIATHKQQMLTEEQVLSLAESTNGYTVFDLFKLCSEVCRKRERNGDDKHLISAYEEFRHQIKQVKPTSLKNSITIVDKVHWDDICGMSEVKQRLRNIIQFSIKYPEVFRRLNVKPARGVLMYGPPGCSKTMLAKALATESDVNFIAIKGPEIFSKWVGESEKAVRELFMKAKDVAPCVIFFDEVDGIVSERGSSNESHVSRRVVTQLLTEIQGAEELEGVYIIAATNRPDMLDPAMLRPGRLDHLVYVPLPDSDTRREILKKKLVKMHIKEDAVDLDVLVERTIGYSGAEVVALCHEAGLLALSENFPAIVDNPSVEMKHFLHALTRILPRIPPETIVFYETISSFC